MKHLSKLILIACMCFATSAYPQNSGDTIKNDFPNHSEIKGNATLELPVFTGAEQDIQDSLQSVGAALTDSTLQATVLNGVKQIKNAPKGGTLDDWIVYLLGLVGLAFGAYSWIRKNFYKNKAQFEKDKLAVAASALELAHGVLKESVKASERKEVNTANRAEHARPMKAPAFPSGGVAPESRSDNSDRLEQIKQRRPPIAQEDKDEAYVAAFNKYHEVFGRMPMDNLTTAELEGYVKRHENKKK